MNRARAPRVAVALALCAASGGGCSPEYDNPFARTDSTRAPSEAADVVFTSNNYTTRAGSPHELFAVEDTGGTLARLTFCNVDTRRCDNVEAAPAPERDRMAVRRVMTDANGDGRLSAADGESLVFIDLTRAVEAELVPATARVTGVDWASQGNFLIYSANGENGREDLWVMDPNGQNNANRTLTGTIAERRPRVNAAGNAAVYERIDATGKGQIFIFSNFRVTMGGPGTEALAGTPYMVGSDADPDFSPDSRLIVFRRLTAVGNGGLGSWDLLTVRTDGTDLRVIASGAAFRGAPDWGTQGILFNEIDVAAGTSALVLLQPDGSGRRVLVTAGAAVDLSFPRWFAPR
jgi:Tol biopolymer transport system component